MKIAVELEQALKQRATTGASGGATDRVLAQGDGWAVTDVICTSGPRDRSFEESNSDFFIAVVAAGSFQYRSAAGRELMTPGSLLLGNANENFECTHDHGAGDRCLSFGYTPDYFERIATAVGASKPRFSVGRLPSLRETSPLIAQACAGIDEASIAAWEQLSIELAARTMQLVSDRLRDLNDAQPSALARVTRIVRRIERQPHDGLTIVSLAREAGLSPYHFLRVFQRLTGLTPHQYIVRARLREAAMRLTKENETILKIAFDCGFGDISNFNHSFRAEFGMSPRRYRMQTKNRK